VTPFVSDWTVVIVGSWNIAILNSDWIGSAVFDVQETEVELLFGTIRPQIKISAPHASLTPALDRVVLNCRRPDEASLAAVERSADRLLEKLPLTPVTAIGINFGYKEQDVPADVAELFRIGDTARISDLDLAITSTTITRQLAYDGRELNFRMIQSANDVLQFHFNYHQNVQSADAARALLAGKMLMYERHSQDMLLRLYQITRQEQGGA
jgi:hypothetical protein